MDNDFAQRPIPITRRFGIQQYGVNGDLWRTVEIVTPQGAYIDHGQAIGTRDAAERAARRKAEQYGD